MDKYAVIFNIHRLYNNEDKFDLTNPDNGIVYNAFLKPEVYETLENPNPELAVGYFGKTTVKNMHVRERAHRNTQNDSCPKFYNAIKKYGEDNFVFTILNVTENEDEAYELEKVYIAENDAINRGLNCVEGGKGTGSGENHPMYGRTGESHPLYGKTHSEEAKQKMSEAHKGKKNPMYGKTGESNPFYGKKHSEEVKQRISEANKGANHYLYGATGDACPFFKGYILVTDAKTNKFVGAYAGMGEIERELKSTKEKKLDRSSITKVLNGKYKSHGGYYYKRISKEEYEALLEQQVS